MNQPNINQPIAGLWRDAIRSLQPKGTWRYALNAQTETFDANSFGLVNEPSNELCFDLGDDWIVLGGGYIEDRDRFLFFARKDSETRSIIGTVSTINCDYEILVDDKDWDDNLCFDKCAFIPVEFKTMVESCNHEIAYFSAGDYYYRLDLDGDLCNLTRDDLLLLRCVCPPTVVANVIPSGGVALRAGAYQFLVQLVDDDGNVTNWFNVSNPVYIEGDTFSAEEITNKAIELQLDGIDNQDWGRVNIGVVKTIGGQKNFFLVDTVPYTSNGLSYRYVGSETEEERDFTEIFARQDRYIRGANLAQKEGRLILFELKNQWNLDYQKQANKINVRYGVFKIRPEEACDYPTLMRDEVYSVGVKWNYCDGTSSAVFHIPGRDATQYDREEIPASDNCTDCDLQRWQVENTASRIINYCEEEYALSARSETKQEIIQEAKVVYTKVATSEVEECCGKADSCSDGCSGGCSGGGCSGKGGGCSGGCGDGDSGEGNCVTSERGEICYSCESGFDLSSYSGLLMDVTLLSDGYTYSDIEVDVFNGEFIHGTGEYASDTIRIRFKDADGTFLEQVDLSYTCEGEGGTAAGEDPNATGGGSGGSGSCPDGNCGDGGCSGGGCSGSGGACIDEECLACGDYIKGFMCTEDDGTERFEADPNGDYYKKEYLAPITKPSSGNEIAETAANNLGCDPTPIYDETGCYIVGYEKPLVAEGYTSYWESLDTYPTTLDCNGDPIYGELAGCPIRHPKMPCELIEPHFISTQTGVPTSNDPSNEVDNETFVYILGLILDGISAPKNPPKPLCKERPFTIVYQKRDAKNKSVIAKGLFTGTFKGQVGEREFLVPKNGVNSLEYFDGNIETESNVRIGADNIASKKHRGGWQATDVAAYNFHSPEMCFGRPFLNATKAKISWELYGQGYRYGLYAEGPDSERELLIGRENQRGARQWVNLNHYKCVSGIERPNECCTDLVVFGDQTTFPSGGGPAPQASLTYRFGADITVDYTVTVRVTTPNGTIRDSYSGTFTPSSSAGDLVLTTELNDTIKNIPLGSTVETTIEFTGVRTRTMSCNFEGKFSLRTEFDEFTTNNQDAKRLFFSSPDCNSEEPTTCGSELRCISGISYADENSIVKKGDEFTYPLMNLNREGSVYLEFEDNNPLNLSAEGGAIDPFLSDNSYNGLPDRASDLSSDFTSDGSFLGDTIIHECPIHKAAGWYGSLKQENAKQYGRLESAPYITLYEGTEKDLLCGNARLCGVGDTWITQYSFVRHSLVSDKIGGREQQKSDNGFGNQIWCDYKCNDVPDSGDGDDRRNQVRLRGFDGSGNEDDTTRGDRCWDGQQNFRGLIGRDGYRPNLLKTQITMWVESSVKTEKRQRGDEENCEIAYPNLGDFELDSNFPAGNDWRESFLNCHYIQQNETPGWKLLARTILAVMTTMAGIIGTLLSGSNPMCRFFDWMFNVKACRVKCLDGGRDCILDRGLIRGTPQNYCRYNWDFSELNTVEVFYGQADPYDTCICEDRNNRIRYSDQQNIESNIDAYRNFRVNSYSELSAEYGSIKNFFHVGNRLFAHTTDMILDLRTDYETLQTSSGDEVLLGRSGFLQRATPIQGGVQEGYAGTLDPHSAITTPLGYFFVDREARKVYRFSGQGLEEISNYGMRNFFKEHLYIDLLNSFPDYDCVDFGHVGYKMGYDHRFNRLLLTKEDYVPREGFILEYLGGEFFSARKQGTKDDPKNKTKIKVGNPKYFINKSFTVSYDPIKQRWISFHSYLPEGYMWNRDHMFSWVGGSVWKHGDNRESYQTFYGRYYPHVIELITYDDNRRWQQYTNTEIETEARRWNNCHHVENVEKTFNQALLYNSNQSTGNLQLIRRNPNNQLDSLKQVDGEARLERTEKRWKVNDFQNRVIDPNIPIFECSEDVSVFDISNEGNIRTKKSQDANDHTLEDDYLGLRLTLDDPEDSSLELITKFILNWNNIR